MRVHVSTGDAVPTRYPTSSHRRTATACAGSAVRGVAHQGTRHPKIVPKVTTPPPKSPYIERRELFHSDRSRPFCQYNRHKTVAGSKEHRQGKARRAVSHHGAILRPLMGT